MENKSEDMEHSFEIYDPTVNSITDSMSIVPIPEPLPRQMLGISQLTTDRSVIQSNSFDEIGNNCDTKRIDSMDGLPTYNQIQEHELLAQQLSNISHNSVADERNQSLQKLSDNLIRIEDNVKNCSNNLEDILTTNLEIYLKEVKEENEKLKAELEKNNHFMKQQLKNLHEWQTKYNQEIELHKQVVQHSEALTQENDCLKGENDTLKDKVNELEGMTSLVDQLTAEVQTLRSKCELMGNYQKFDVPSELQTQELNSRLVEYQIKIDVLNTEINNLKRELSGAHSRLDTLPAMESQLYVFERDFKIEEMSKMAALKEVAQLEQEIERLKLMNSQLEERLDKGSPALDIKDDSVGKHHRRSRRSGKL